MHDANGFSDEDMKALLPLFLASGRSYIGALREGLLLLRNDRGGPEVFKSMHRAVHSLKGAALQIGFDSIGSLARATEEAIEGLSERDGRAPADALDAIDESARVLSCGLDQLEAGQTPLPPPPSLLQRLGEHAALSADEPREQTGS